MKNFRWTQKTADFLLATCGAGWGLSYIAMKIIMDEMGPFWMITLRFGFAFLLVALIFLRKVSLPKGDTLKGAIWMGIFNFLIFVTLLQGLKWTTATNAGFLCSTSVVITPVIHAVITRKMPSKRVILCCFIALVGIGCMTIKESLTISVYDLWCLACAFAYAGLVLVTSHYTKKCDSLNLGIWQLFFSAVFTAAYAAFTENFAFVQSANGYIAFAVMVCICTAWGFVMQAICQKFTTPEHASLMFCLEPISSAFFGFICFGEVIAPIGYFGAALILLAVVLCSVKPKENNGKQY